jgi:hypothetical protein
MAEEALPRILGSKSLSTKVKEEMKHHHRWIGIVFFYCKRFPRMLRVVSLATNITVMLFVQSITYNLSHGDDGTCESYRSEQTCLAEKSTFQTGASKCYWNIDEMKCAFVQPDQDIKVVIFVAILSSIISTPLALLADWMIQTVLAAPTLSKRNSIAPRRRSNILARQSNVDSMKGVINIAGKKTFTSVVPIISEDAEVCDPKRQSDAFTDDKFIPDSLLTMIQAEQEFSIMTTELQAYRKEHLMGKDEQLKEFDSKSLPLSFCILQTMTDLFCFHSFMGPGWTWSFYS